jgi:hypothetical protein
MRCLWSDQLGFIYTGEWLQDGATLKLQPPHASQIVVKGQSVSPSASPTEERQSEPPPPASPLEGQQSVSPPAPPVIVEDPPVQPTIPFVESTAAAAEISPNTNTTQHDVGTTPYGDNMGLDMNIFTAHIEAISDLNILKLTVKQLENLHSLALSKLARMEDPKTKVNVYGEVLDFAKVLSVCYQNTNLFQCESVPQAPVWYERVRRFSPTMSFDMPGKIGPASFDFTRQMFIQYESRYN